jgi:hypothetical protein
METPHLGSPRTETHNPPIFRLPVEIICDISLLAVYRLREGLLSERYAGKPKQVTHAPDPPPWDWLAVGQVCSYWRRVLLEYPDFWSVIAFNTPAACIELADRSQAAPLSLTTDLDYWNTDNVCQFIAWELNRTKKLDLHCINDIKINPVLKSVMEISAPSLEVLEIHISCFSQIQFDTRCAPQLRELCILGLNIPWELNLFRGLTRIELGNNWGWKHVNESAIYNAFAQLAPTVEIIQFSGRALYQERFFEEGYPDYDTPHHITSRAKRIEFPRLAELILTGDILTCSDILDVIVPTKHLRLKLEFRRIQNRFRDLGEILPWLSRYAELQPESEPAGIDTVGCLPYHISANGDRRGHCLDLFFEFKAPSPRATILLHSEHDNQFDINYPARDFKLDRTLTYVHCAFWSGLHLPNVKRLVLGLIPTTSNELIKAYKDMKEVEIVEINEGSGSLANFADALMGDATPASSSLVLFPKLQHLVVEGFVATFCYAPDGESRSPEGDILIKCARMRKAVGFPLHALEIRKSYAMPERILSELKEHIEVVNETD